MYTCWRNQVSEGDTTVRISREEKQALDAARNIWEEQNSRRISAGEFIRILAARYLAEAGRQPSSAGQGGNLIAAQEARPIQPGAVTPGPQVYLVNCWRCNGQIGWRMDLGLQGVCPYCGAWLHLVI